MKVKTELVTALREKLAKYGVELEENEAQSYFNSIISNGGQNVGENNIVMKEALSVWQANIEASDGAATPATPA